MSIKKCLSLKFQNLGVIKLPFIVCCSNKMPRFWSLLWPLYIRSLSQRIVIKTVYHVNFKAYFIFQMYRKRTSMQIQRKNIFKCSQIEIFFNIFALLLKKYNLWFYIKIYLLFPKDQKQIMDTFKTFTWKNKTKFLYEY